MHIAEMDEAPKTPLDRWMREHDRDDAAVAAELGTVSRSQVNRLRNGTSRPSLVTAKALEALTGVPAIELLEGPHDPSHGSAAA